MKSLLKALPPLKGPTLKGQGKGGLPVGTIRVWRGQRFYKRAPGDWIMLSDKAFKKEEPKEKPLDHKKAPNLNLNFHDQMAPEAGKGRHVSVSKEQLSGLLKDGNFGFISAGRNPASELDKKLQDAQIEQRYDKLRQDLEKEGYKFTEIMGHYGAPEKSFLVMNPDRKVLEKLGKQYNQDSVIFGDSGKQEMIFTTGENEGKSHQGEGWKEVPEAKDFYSEVPLTNGQRMKFSLNFDFSSMKDSSKEEAQSKEVKNPEIEEEEDGFTINKEGGRGVTRWLGFDYDTWLDEESNLPYEKVLLLEELEVSPEKQGRGLGGALLDSLKKEAQKRGADAIFTNASPIGVAGKAREPEKLESLILFYKKHGFEVYKKEKNNALMILPLEKVSPVKKDLAESTHFDEED